MPAVARTAANFKIVDGGIKMDNVRTKNNNGVNGSGTNTAKSGSKIDTRKLVTLGLLAAIAFVMTALVHIPLVPEAAYLTYDPKDIILVMAGLIFGPVEALIVTVVVSLIEWVTIGTTGPIGFVMNVFSSCAFAVTAAFIYKKMHNMKGAVIGLVSGMLCMTVVMLLWNYLITPLYTGMPRQAIAAMLLPVFLPFNLIKSGINATLTMLIYKPVVRALRKTHLIPEREETPSKGIRVAVTMIISAFLFLTFVAIVLVQFKILG